MVACYIHALPHIKTVRAKPLHAGIQVQFSTSVLAGYREQGIQKRSPQSGRPVRRVCNKIIHVKKLSPSQILEQPVTGYCQHCPFILNVE